MIHLSKRFLSHSIIINFTNPKSELHWVALCYMKSASWLSFLKVAWFVWVESTAFCSEPVWHCTWVKKQKAGEDLQCSGAWWRKELLSEQTKMIVMRLATMLMMTTFMTMTTMGTFWATGWPPGVQVYTAGANVDRRAPFYHSLSSSPSYCWSCSKVTQAKNLCFKKNQHMLSKWYSQMRWYYKAHLLAPLGALAGLDF